MLNLPLWLAISFQVVAFSSVFIAFLKTPPWNFKMSVLAFTLVYAAPVAYLFVVGVGWDATISTAIPNLVSGLVLLFYVTGVKGVSAVNTSAMGTVFIATHLTMTGAMLWAFAVWVMAIGWAHAGIAILLMLMGSTSLGIYIHKFHREWFLAGMQTEIETTFGLVIEDEESAPLWVVEDREAISLEH